ncbi:hypothetical protein BaRGS_00022718 [Batillaria attramentaria]|uniref:Uncharacterized protein n=1 Tax=Batillaria attramentaria TaxID=370345 RepID=A0ABD0KG14_9CAEN
MARPVFVSTTPCGNCSAEERASEREGKSMCTHVIYLQLGLLRWLFRWVRTVWGRTNIGRDITCLGVLPQMTITFTFVRPLAEGHFCWPGMSAATVLRGVRVVVGMAGDMTQNSCDIYSGVRSLRVLFV